MGVHHPLRRAILPAFAFLALAGCEDDLTAPAAPSSVPEAPAHVALVLLDLHQRVLPGMEDPALRASIGRVLPRSIDDPRGGVLRDSDVARVRVIIEGLLVAGDASIDPAERDVILLSLDYARSALQPPESP